MSLLQFTPTRCVRALSVLSTCTTCADVCPTAAITTSGRLPSINQASCVGCGGCVAACPTEALGLDDFDATEFFFSFASEEGNLISCQKNIPCLSALSPEHMIALSGLKSGLRLDIGHCGGCEIGQSVLGLIRSRAEHANYLLEAADSTSQVDLAEECYRDPENAPETYKDRRDFFKTFHLKGIARARRDFEKEVVSTTDVFVDYSIEKADTRDLRMKKITDRRKLFYTAMKRFEKPRTYHVVDAGMISFTSQKLLDEGKCTACEMCYRVCPTGALSSDMRNSKIDFDPFLCVKCHLCHDVCEPEAITLSSSYNLKEWFEPAVQNLVTFSVRRCDECDTLFSSIAGEKICRRCRLEEEEARELWGI